MGKKPLLFISICLIMFVVIGCGNKTTIEEKGKINTLQEIKERKKVIVATEATFPPYEFVENGKIIGYGSDILAEIVKSLGVELEQHDVELKGILPGLEAKKFDFIPTALIVSDERKEKYGLTTPIGISEYVYTKRAGNSELTSKEQLIEKKIGCVTSGRIHRELTKQKEQLEKEGKPSFEIVSFSGSPEAFLGLKNGQVDVILFSKTVTLEIMKKNPEVYEILDTFKDEKDYVVWATRKEDKELLDFINTEILKMKKSGKLAELQEKWFGYTFDLPNEI